VNPLATREKRKLSVTRNGCKVCAPLGASLVFRGIEGAVPFLHGSQGCATYIRRYLISHFREPMDIASSSFSEETAIFGGKENLLTGLKNVYLQYKPQLIGIATTCLSETIGDDVRSSLKELRTKKIIPSDVKIVCVSCPSFKGTHMDGFYSAVREVVSQLCVSRTTSSAKINIFPSFISCADARYLKEICVDFGLGYVMLPDYSQTLDGPVWDRYHAIPAGGTPVAAIETMAHSCASVEFSSTIDPQQSAGQLLNERFRIRNFQMGIPIGIGQTDHFFGVLEKIAGKRVPEKYLEERGRLIDAYVDGHKYLFGKRAAVYGEEDMVAAAAGFLTEIGVEPVLCVSGGASGRLKAALQRSCGEAAANIIVREDSDFMDMEDELESLKPDILIGNSKGYSAARRLKIPLVRAFFPIHDRIGGQRILHIGYRGTQRFFDDIVNTLLSGKQDDSEIGYTYL
jgi:nitrogenase molybdenum-iron protein NifN